RHVVAQFSQASVQPVEAAVDLVEASVNRCELLIDRVELLLCLRLECQQVLVHALELPRQESERALNFADTAFQVPNLGFDIHGHEKSLSQKSYSAASVLRFRSAPRLPSTGLRNAP